ncbi:MAG: hypothetical protein K2X86_03105 [Cytophagaceae bacterium]|nr:hypothetical protein [Cytophagaceae bacterium]
MKKVTSIFLLMLCIYVPFSTFAVDLVYKWKAGTVYRFQATESDVIAMTMNMMGMNQSQSDTYKTETTFALKINSVQPDGAADAILYVESFKVTNNAGKIIASMASLPKEALKTAILIDKKGNFTVKKEIHAIIQDTGTLLVSGKAGKNKVEASATYPNGEKHTVHAEFDPKTGTLKAGWKVENVGKPQEKIVEVKEDAQEIQVLPYSFLEMLRLPDGDIKAGQTVNVKSAGAEMTIKAESILNNVVTMNCDFKTDMKKAMESNGSTNIKTTTEKKTDDMNNNNMDMDMDGMNNNGDMNNDMNMDMNIDMNTGMNNNTMSKEEKAMVPDSKTDGKITVTFDALKGMFKTLNGTINSSTKASGIDMTVKSTLTMKALN